MRSARFRPVLLEQLTPQITLRGVASFAVAALTLFVALNLSQLVSYAVITGFVPRTSLGWTIYTFIPMRWLVPLAVALFLARGEMPGLFVIALFVAAFAQTNATLIGHVPLVRFLQLSSPALILSVFCVAVRYVRRARFAATLALVALICYGFTGLPWIQLYLRTVVSRTSGN